MLRTKNTQANVSLLACAVFAALVGLLVVPSAWGIDEVFQRTLRVNAVGIEGACAFGEVTGDTSLDIVIARQSREWGPPNAPGGADAPVALFEIAIRRNDGTDNWPTASTITYSAVTIPNQFYNTAHSGDGQGFNGNDGMSDIAIADMDRDGHNDIVACTLADGIFWFRNQAPYTGTSWSTAQVVYRRGTGSPDPGYPNVRRIFPVNVDGDTDMDIVAAISESPDAGGGPSPNNGSKLSLFWNNGSQVFAQKIIDIDPNLKFIISCTAGDLVNADGRPELVVTTLTNDVVRWYVNNGGTDASTAYSAGYLITNVATDPSYTAIGDFNKTGGPDIVVVSALDGKVRWFENNGALNGTNFQIAHDIDTRAGGAPQYVAAADMDGNSYPDVVATFSATNELVWYENNAGVFTTHVIANNSTPTPDTGPQNVNLAVAQPLGPDNPYPYVDIMVGNVGSQTVSFWHNMTYNSGPSVSNIQTRTSREILVTFSLPMNLTENPGATIPSTYSVSGPGMGTLTLHPDSVVRYLGTSTTQFRLIWNSPKEMLDGEDITVTVPNTLHENDGVLPANVPIHEPLSASALALGVLPTVGASGGPSGDGVVVVDAHNIDITFSEAMLAASGILTAANYTISGGGAVMMPGNPSSVAFRAGTTYRLTWLTGDMSSGGDVIITVANVTDLAGNLIDSADNWGQGVGIGTRPSADVITYSSPNPTNATSISFNVQFSKNVIGFNNAGDLVFTEQPGLTHTTVNITGSNTDYVVTVSGISGNGTMAMAVSTASDVTDVAFNTLLSSVTSTPPLLFDQTKPNVSAVSVLGPNPTHVPQFTVSFDEDVQLFNDALDLILTPTGSLAYTGLNITGGPRDYTVTILGASGAGNLTLQVQGASDVKDMSTNLLNSTAPTATVAVDMIPPNAVIITPTTVGPTSSSVIGFTVDFDKNVVAFDDISDLVFIESGVTHTGAVISGGPQSYAVQITGVAGDGTLALAVKTGAEGSDIHDAALNLVASSVISGDVDIDNVGPTATVISINSPNPTNGSTATFWVTFNEIVDQFDVESDLVIVETGTLLHTGVIIMGGPQNADFQVLVSGMTGEGTMTLAVRVASPGNVRDLTANGLTASVTSAPLVVDLTPPRAVTIAPTTPNPTKDAIVSFSVTFSEDVQHFNNMLDLVLTENGVGHDTITITGGPLVYTVEIGGVYGNGDMTLAVAIPGLPPATSDVADIAGTALASSVTSIPVVVDQTNPTATVNTLLTKSPVPALSGALGDNLSGVANVTVSVNGNDCPTGWSATAWGTTVVVPLGEGTYDVVVTVTDAAGNVATDATLNELTVDLTPPTVTVTTQITNIATPTISGMVTDNIGVSTVRFRVNGFWYDAVVNTGTGAWSGQVTHALPALFQQYDVEAIATDTVGNEGTDSTTNELTIDPNAPEVYVNTLVTNNNRPTMSGSASFGGLATGIISVSLTVSGYPMPPESITVFPPVGTTCAWTATVPTGIPYIPDGIYDIAASALDNLGRTGSDGTTNELTIDTMPPTTIFALEDPTPTSQSTVDMLVTFSEPVAPTFDTTDIALTGTLAGSASFVLGGTGPIYAVALTLNDPDMDGTIGIRIKPTVNDPALNFYIGGTSPLYHIHNWFGFNLHPQTAYAYEGESHSFSVGASFGKSTPAYAWKWDDGTVHTVGGNTATYTIPDVTGKAGKYWCDVTYDGITYSSNQATLYVAPPVHITQQPLSQTKLIGESCDLNVLAAGGFAPLTYQWIKGGVIVHSSTNSTYSIAQVNWNDGGTYHVVVMDTQSGTATSNYIQLTVGQNLPAVGLAGLTLLILACAFWGYRRTAVLRK